MLRKKAFTLIELLVVISIIALLMAIMMPALGKVREMGKITVCKTRLKNLSTATLAYASSNDSKLPVPYWQSKASETTWRSYVMKETDDAYGRNNSGDYGTNVFGFGWLWQAKYLDDPDVFVCPGIKKQDINMEYIERMLYSFDDDAVCKRVDAQYSYIPLTAKPHRISGAIDNWPIAKKAFELSGSSALCMDKMRSISDFVHVKGSGEKIAPLVNVSFGDGHVVTSDNRTFFTKDKVNALRNLGGYGIIPNRDLFDFLSTMEQ